MIASNHKRHVPMRAGALLLSLAAAGGACARGGAAAAAGARGASAPVAANVYQLPPGSEQVSTAVVRSEPVADELDLAASVQADPARVVRVYTPVSGRLLEVAVRPADYVRRGQVLAEVASSDVAAARALYEQTDADAQLKQEALARMADLYAHRAVALKDYQQAQADARMAAAALAGARERLALIGADPRGDSDLVSVRAPRAGVVVDLGAANGEFSKSLDNADPLCTIADLSTVWAVGDVFEHDLARVTPGRPVDLTVSAWPGEVWHGTVGAISSLIDPATRTASVRVVLANPGFRLKPNMFGRLRVTGAVRVRLVVPQTAVLREGTDACVFVQVRPGAFERRTVVLGRNLGADRVEVASGLSSGDTIVTEGATLLRAAISAS
jgi:membrane fusion protein, heavy metal efflux system